MKTSVYPSALIGATHNKACYDELSIDVEGAMTWDVTDKRMALEFIMEELCDLWADDGSLSPAEAAPLIEAEADAIHAEWLKLEGK